MATRTIANGGGNWGSIGTWVEGAVPTSADAVVATATSGNVTIDADADCATAVLTNYVGTLTHNAGVKLRLHSTATTTVLLMPTGMTYTAAPTSEIVIATASVNARTVNVSGKTLGRLIYTVSASTGALILNSPATWDTINVTGGRTLKLPGGNTRAISLTTVRDWDVNGTAGNIVTVESASTTFAAILRASPSSYTFADTTGNVFTARDVPAFVPGYLRTDQLGLRAGSLGTLDSAALSITSDIDIIVRVAMDDWTPGADKYFFSKFNSYRFLIRSTNFLGLMLNSTIVSADAALTVTDGDTMWIRVTWRNSDNRVQFFSCPDQETEPTAGQWTQLGTDRTISLTSIADTTSAPAISTSGFGSGTAEGVTGRFYRVLVKNGIDGTAVLDADFTAEHPYILSDYISLTRVGVAGLVDWWADHSVDSGDNLYWNWGTPVEVTDFWTVGRLAVID